MATETFRMLDNELSSEVIAKDRTDRNAWNITIASCVMRYINDALYMSGETTLEEERSLRSSESTVQFLQSRAQLLPGDSNSL